MRYATMVLWCGPCAYIQLHILKNPKYMYIPMQIKSDHGNKCQKFYFVLDNNECAKYTKR